jgi:hypothetical protein
MDNLRAAQGVIRLAKRYGVQRLEAACERALRFDNARYRAVKTILEKGLDQLPPARQRLINWPTVTLGQAVFAGTPRC